MRAIGQEGFKMGRKKIQISRITDERNRQVEKTLKIIAMVVVVIMMASVKKTMVAMLVAVMGWAG